MSTDSIYIVGPIIAFGVLLLFLMIDTVLSTLWNKWYFTNGLTLFTMRIPVNDHHTNIPSKLTLETQFSSLWFGSLAFKKISPNSYGFCQEFLTSGFMRSWPIMHGLLIFDDVNNQITVKGFANWFPLVFLLIGFSIFVMNVFSNPIGTIVFFGFFILAIGVSYAMQYSRFSEVADIAFEAWARERDYLGRLVE